MTAQEQEMLRGLVDRINGTQLANKDADAEQFIQQGLGRNPDSLYIMSQTLLVQQYALEQAQKQIADLRAQLDQARSHVSEPTRGGSFLGNLLGRHDEPQRMPPPPPPPQYGPGLAYPSGGYPIAGAPQQGGGFLRSAMQTAAGVVAGALAFEGVESLMHGFGHSAGYGTEFSGAGFGSGHPEEVVNNYYGDGSEHEHAAAGMASGGLDRHDSLVDHRDADTSQSSQASDANDSASSGDASYAADQSGDVGDEADELSGTEGSDYSSDGDDSMLADDIGDGDQASDGGDDSGSGLDSSDDGSGF